LVRVVFVAVVAMGAAFTVSACKQGDGERCQVESDCESGLTCTTLGFCGSTTIDLFDAAPAFDARVSSGTDADTTPTIDAGLDATPADAAPSDAAPDAS